MRLTTAVAIDQHPGAMTLAEITARLRAHVARRGKEAYRAMNLKLVAHKCLLGVTITIAATAIAGCYATQKGTLRSLPVLPRSTKVEVSEQPLLVFQGKISFTWIWPGSLQGQAQDYVEKVGYFQWTNAEEAANYKLVVNIRRYRYSPSAAEWLSAILYGVTLTLFPAFTETDTYELDAEMVARPSGTAGSLGKMRRLGTYRPRGNYAVVKGLLAPAITFFTSPSARSFTRYQRLDGELIRNMLKDVVVWAGETVEKK
jgi:hypothetical protein